MEAVPVGETALVQHMTLSAGIDVLLTHRIFTTARWWTQMCFDCLLLDSIMLLASCCLSLSY